ncbi:hypothetical protein N0B31_00955 [Salinirubellus salinus]|uniref:Uncharacterized protein n=1 Tax=Salinirubellus salinus TaxID=1364945 RepID=A0A9E7R3G7_9EURY|nr:hypothetical protein [Salinirubellus salinus]UWM54862.1 hypothetical protein N0B31_00955 [Salinirubellus salinus]
MTGPSRRDVLRASAGVGLAALTASAGCTEQISDFTGGGGVSTDSAPAASRGVFTADVQGLLGDENTARLANAYLGVVSQNEYYSGPESYEAVLDEAEAEATLPPSGLQSVLGFGEFGYFGFGGDAYAGAVFEAEWSETEVVDALEDGGATYTEGEYSGTTTYTNDSEYVEAELAVLGDGRYVVGSTDAVEDAVDVANGEGDAIGSALSNAYDGTRDGYVRYGAEVPDDSLPRRIPVGGETVELDAYQRVTHSGGALYSNGDTVGLEVVFVAVDSQAAEAVVEQTEALVTVAKSTESTTEEVEAALDRLTVSQDGDTVSTTYETTVAELETRIEALGEQYG